MIAFHFFDHWLLAILKNADREPLHLPIYLVQARSELEHVVADLVNAVYPALPVE